MAGEDIGDRKYLADTYRKVGGLLLGQAFGRPSTDGHYYTRGPVRLGDYDTTFSREHHDRIPTAIIRKRMLRTVRAALTVDIADGPSVHLFIPKLYDPGTLWAIPMFRQGVDFDYSELAMIDVAGRVKRPQEHPSAAYISELPEPRESLKAQIHFPYEI